MTASGGVLTVNGASLFFAEHGEGAPLVLLHGGLSSHVDWAPLLPELAGHRTIAPDSRGHGRSDNPARSLSYPALADDVAALVAALGLDRPVVAGWSDGGQVALELGARHPGVAGGLVVGAAHPEFEASGLRETHRALLSADAAGVPDLDRLEQDLGEHGPLLRARHPGGPDRWAELVRQTAGMWLGYEGLAPAQLDTITVPVLVLAGDRDELVPLRLSTALFRQLPDAELAVVPGLGHDGPSPERAAVLAALIDDFARRRVAA